MRYNIQLIPFVLALSLTLSYGAFAQTTTQSQKFGANPTSIAPSAVLEIESSNKGVLFPRVTLTSTSDVTTIATPALGLTVFNTASAGTSPNNVTTGYYYWNGSKWVKMAVETPFAKTVYVNATSPTTATIFDENNPPATNNNALKADDVNLYIGNNGSTWTYNTSTSAYNTFTVPASTPFNLAGTTTDAGSNKTGAIDRTGSVTVTNGFLRASGNSNSFTIDPTQGSGPRLMLGPTATPNGFFELGAYNSINNFDTKGRDFNIFSAARANALYLKHNPGSIGIGTNDPLSTLHVHNPLGATQTINADATLLRLSRPTGARWGNVAQFNLGSYTTGGSSHSRLDFALNDGGDLTTLNTIMTLQANGNTGLGLTAPTQRLDVNGSGLFRRGNSTGSAFNQILFGFNSGSNFQHAIKTRHAGGTAQGNAIDFYVWTNAVTDAVVGTQHLMSLEGQGRVGIGGITNPTAVIDAASTGVATATVNASRKMLRLSIPTASGVKFENVAEFNMGSYAVEGTSAKTRLDLLLNDGLNNAVSQAMTWQANGNVGIGTTAPATTLEVANINTTAFQSTINASSNPAALSTAGFNDANPNITKASSGIQFLGWNGKKEGGIFRQSGSNDKSHLLFTVNTTNDVALTINESRNVGIGTTAPTQRLHIKGINAQPATTGTVSNAIVRIDGSSSHALDIGTYTNSPYGSYIQSVTTTDLAAILPLVLNPTGGNVGIGVNNPSQALQVNGNIAASGTVSSAGTTLTSDARLKSNIINLSQGLNKIMQLNPVNYDKKVALDSAATLNENGFIAQELQKIMPELVSEGKDKDKLLSVNYTAIIPVLTKAVQEQQAIIEKQQMQINELKALLEKVLKNK